MKKLRQERKRADERDADCLEILQEPLDFRRTFDGPQYSMDILQQLIPDAAKCRVVDIYSRRQSITN